MKFSYIWCITATVCCKGGQGKIYHNHHELSKHSLGQKSIIKKQNDITTTSTSTTTTTPLKERVANRISDINDLHFFLDKSSPELLLDGIDILDLNSVALSVALYFSVAQMKKWLINHNMKWQALSFHDNDVVNKPRRRLFLVMILFLFKNVHAVT